MHTNLKYSKLLTSEIVDKGGEKQAWGKLELLKSPADAIFTS